MFNRVVDMHLASKKVVYGRLMFGHRWWIGPIGSEQPFFVADDPSFPQEWIDHPFVQENSLIRIPIETWEDGIIGRPWATDIREHSPSYYCGFGYFLSGYLQRDIVSDRSTHRPSGYFGDQEIKHGISTLWFGNHTAGIVQRVESPARIYLTQYPEMAANLRSKFQGQRARAYFDTGKTVWNQMLAAGDSWTPEAFMYT